MSQTVPAHFDGEHILLDARKGLHAAYDNGEEDYSLDLIKEPNPEHEMKVT